MFIMIITILDYYLRLSTSQQFQSCNFNPKGTLIFLALNNQDAWNKRIDIILSPILIVQYMHAYGWASDHMGEPFMMIIPPIEQFTNNYFVEAFS